MKMRFWHRTVEWFGNSAPPMGALLLACAAVWFLRFLLLGVPALLVPEEGQVANGWNSTPATEFFATHDWAEKWEYLATLHQSQSIPFAFMHLTLAKLVPNDGQWPLGASPVCAAIAAIALAVAAWRIFDKERKSSAAFLCLALVSFSPMFLVYSIRADLMMHGAMWICLALAFLSTRRWRFWEFILGGLFLGLAYVEGEIMEPVALAVAAGFVLSIPCVLFDTRLKVPIRIWRFFLALILTTFFCVLVPAILLHWSRYSGSKVGEQYLDPAGWKAANWAWKLRPDAGWSTLTTTWFRRLLELDPLLELAFFCGLAGFLGSRLIRWWWKILVIAIAIPVLLLFWLSFDGASTRATVSMLLFAVAGVPALLTFRARPAPRPSEDSAGESGSSFPAFGWPGLVFASLVLLFAYSRWPQFSGLPKQTFPAWPLFVLPLTGMLLVAFRGTFAMLVRFTFLIGTALCLVALTSLYLAKSADYRSLIFLRQHSQMARVPYSSFLSSSGSWASIDKTAPRPFVVMGDLWPIYPGAVYDIPQFNPEQVRKQLHEGQLDWIPKLGLGWYSFVLYEELDPTGMKLPPSGTPEVPARVEPDTLIGGRVILRENNYRGMELRLPELPSGGKGEAGAVMTLACTAKGPIWAALGFEWGALSPYIPAEYARIPGITLSVEIEDKSLAKVCAPINALVPTDSFEFGWTSYFQTLAIPVFIEKPGEVRIRLVARVESPKGKRCPPISCYIRRPFLTSTPYPASLPVAGFASLVDADDSILIRNNFRPPAGPLLFGRRGGRGVAWKTAAWPGDTPNPFMFVGTWEGAGRCALDINGVHIMDFQPSTTDQVWTENNFRLKMKFLATNEGNHGVFLLGVPAGFSPAHEPIEIRVRVLDGADNFAWFGLRSMANPSNILPLAQTQELMRAWETIP